MFTIFVSETRLLSYSVTYISRGAISLCYKCYAVLTFMFWLFIDFLFWLRWGVILFRYIFCWSLFFWFISLLACKWVNQYCDYDELCIIIQNSLNINLSQGRGRIGKMRTHKNSCVNFLLVLFNLLVSSNWSLSPIWFFLPIWALLPIWWFLPTWYFCPYW